MNSRNYVNTNGFKLVRTTENNYIPFMRINTMSNILPDTNTVIVFRIYNINLYSFEYSDYQASIFTTGGESRASFQKLGNTKSTNTHIKLIKSNNEEKYIIVAKGSNVWQDLSCQVLYSNKPTNIDMMPTYNAISSEEITSNYTEIPIKENEEENFSFTVNNEAKVYLDTTYQSRIDKLYDYGIIGITLYTQGDTRIEDGTLLLTLPFKPKDGRPIIENITYLGVEDNSIKGVTAISIDKDGKVFAKATIPPKVRISIRTVFRTL